MAEDDDLWTFEVESVNRLDASPEDEDVGPFFAVTFDVCGPNASAEIEITVVEVPDPSQIIIMAMAHLHLALAAWARITAGRLIANDDK